MFDQRRATVFGEWADHYDRYRPSYPAAVIDMAVERRPTNAVDAGCGTGKAAVLVAERGVVVAGVEPDPRMAEVARSRGVDVTVSSIEDWAVAPCDLMYSAQAWHWVDPARGAEIAAAAIRPGGQWIAFWNYETESSFTESRDAVYRRVAPELRGMTVSSVDESIRLPVSTALAETGDFEPLQVREVVWTDHVSAEEAVQRLASHSSHRVLEPGRAEAIDDELTRELGGPATTIALPYTTRVFSAGRH